MFSIKTGENLRKQNTLTLPTLWFLLVQVAFGQSYVSPLEGSLFVHDPVIIKEEDTYHIYFTGRWVSHKTSSNRIFWESAGTVFNQNVSWVGSAVPGNNGFDYWAPDVFFHNNRYWLYYSVSTFGQQVSAIGLATSPSLNNPNWSDQGIVVQSQRGDPYNAIDPNIIKDKEGKMWMSWGSFWQGLYIIELDTASGKPLDDASPIHIAGRGGKGTEAPFIVYKYGYYYLFSSWDKCCDGVTSTYNIRVGRSEKVTGPYEDKEGARLLDGGGSLIDDGDSRWIGPGHNSVITDNDTTFLVNHAYDANQNGRATLMIRPLYWTEDNWPSLNPEDGEVTPEENTSVKSIHKKFIPFEKSFFTKNGIYYDVRGRGKNIELILK